MDEVLDRLPGFDRRIRDRLRDVSRKFSADGESPDRDGDCDYPLFERTQLVLGSLRRRGASRDDRGEDYNDLRAGGVDIGVRSGHELASSQRRCLISGMEELVRLWVGGSRGTLGFRRLEQSADGGGRNSRPRSRDSTIAHMRANSPALFFRRRPASLFFPLSLLSKT